MTVLLDVLSGALILVGAGFFTAGTIGLLRFPDVRTQLHALTKADNLGLGMILLGVAFQLGSWGAAGVLLLTWLLALGAASVSAQMLAGFEVRRNRARAAEGQAVDDSRIALGGPQSPRPGDATAEAPAGEAPAGEAPAAEAPAPPDLDSTPGDEPGEAAR